MSSENHGVPEDDDPFAYLYRGDGADGSAAPETAPLPGVPRTSYHQATQVGRTQYGQPQQAPQGYQKQAQLPHQEQPTAQYTPQQYGQPQQSQYSSTPPSQPGGRAGARAAGGSGGGGRNGRGVMIGTIAVGVAVVIGICVALFNSGSDKTAAGSGTSTSPAGASASTGPTDSPTPTADPTTGTVAPADAATMTLTGGAKSNNNWAGALGAGGNFVDGMTNVGATVTWNVNAPAKGSYSLWIHFANATGKEASVAVAVNQKPLNSPIPLRDYGSNGKWTSWFSTYATISLKKGQNAVALSCAAGADCTFNLDQLALTPPGGSENRPSTWH